MSEDQTVIYTARTAPEAHMLKNLLTEMGIPAVVENDRLEGAGLGANLTDWTTQVRVVVPGQHALLARQIALEFERKGLAGPAEPPIERPVQQQSPPVATSDDGSAEEEESTK